MSRFNEAYASAQRTQEEMVAQRREKAREELTAENRIRCAEVFPAGFSSIPKGFQFPLENVPGAMSASVFATPNGGRSLVIDVQGEVSKKGRDAVRVNDSYYVDAKGRITGPLERDRRLPTVDAQILLREVLSRCAETMISGWRDTDLALNPEGQNGISREAAREEKGPPVSKIEELARIALLAKQEGILVRIVNAVEGFEGYRLYVFGTFAVMESGYNGNAAYIIDFDEEIPLSPAEMARMSKRELDAYLMAIPGAQAITLSRAAKRGDRRVQRIVHRGNWEERLQAAIDLRRRRAQGMQRARQQLAENDTEAEAA